MFKIYKRRDDESRFWWFEVLGDNHFVLARSKIYISKAGLLVGIEATRRAAKSDKLINEKGEVI